MYSTRLASDKNRGQESRQILGCHGERSVTCQGERPCASWPSNNKLSSRTQYELSSRTQCGDLLAMRLLLSFHSIAMTISGLSSRTQCGDLGFCHYERSEVIQKSSVACEEIASVTTFHRNDKSRMASCGQV